MDEQYIDMRSEMELIKNQQQKLQIENRYGNEREVWKLQIVWEYLKDKLLQNTYNNYRKDYERPDRLN